MKTVINLDTVLVNLIFFQYGKTWGFDRNTGAEAPVNPTSTSVHQYYIIDDTRYDPEYGYPNVFGVTIDFKGKELTLHVIRKRQGWTPRESIGLTSSRSLHTFDHVMKSKERFIKSIQHAMSLETVKKLLETP